jgi:hypothetical protein
MKANRWSIAVAGVFLQMALGAVYAWSVFRVPLRKQFGWSIRFSRGRDGGFGRASLVISRPRRMKEASRSTQPQPMAAA